MSIWGRRIPLGPVVIVAAVLVAVIGVARVATIERPREITLVARDMAFYLEADARSANPAIEVKPGETIRVVLKNRDRGITHDFAVPAVEAATDALAWNQQDAVTFRAPEKPGSYEYVCRPHLLMMKGELRVVGE